MPFPHIRSVFKTIAGCSIVSSISIYYLIKINNESNKFIKNKQKKFEENKIEENKTEKKGKIEGSITDKKNI